MKTETLAVRAGREDFDRLGVHASPIDFSTTYPFSDLEAATASYDSMAAGGAPLGTPVYQRLHNPTVARFEEALAALEGAEEAVAFASGMAAISAVLLAARRDGGHLVATRPVYGCTDHLLNSGLLGYQVTFAAPDAIGDAIRPDTALVLTETPANPTLALVDIASVVRQADNVPVMVDSTFATPILQQPLRHGAAFAVHSATKFLGGHGDVLGGVVATSAAWAIRLRQVRILTGGLLHPLAGYLLHRGLQTLPVRVRTQQEHARQVAEALARHPAVLQVLWPGLPGQDRDGLLGRQLLGPGSVLAFRVRGGLVGASTVLRQLKLLTRAVSLGAVDTLIEHPAGLTHRIVGGALAEIGIAEDLLRLSVGLEAPEDVLADLHQALDHLLALTPAELSVA